MTITSIDISLNGKSHQITDCTCVADLLHTLGFTGMRVAVIRNGEIIPRGRHAEVTIAEGDKLEIVGAVGGG